MTPNDSSLNDSDVDDDLVSKVYAYIQVDCEI